MSSNLPERSTEQEAMQSLEPPRSPNACDFCHAAIAADAVYHRLTLGLNEDGPPGSTASASAVEETAELLVCSSCQPRVGISLDRFIENLWSHRRDPNEPEEPIPPTQPDPGAPPAPLDKAERVTSSGATA